MLQCDHFMPPDSYNQIIKEHLRETGFYHIFYIGVVQCQSALVNDLIERWRLEIHTFYFLVGECAVTLENVAIILSISMNGLPVTGPTLSSYEALEAKCLNQFSVTPRKTDYEDGDEDEDEDKDEDEDADDADYDDDGGPDDGLAPSGGTTTSKKGKGYNLRVDPLRRNANRYTPSAFNRVAKKCKKLYKDEKLRIKK
ncbi:hypothetical protein Ahy_A05g023445 [Arachis hypogaea]|uniref:Aminotransferase-like plant mobile domain-containing protein n=1 Tax=Arachis hypogaea TaxID=3818 RepID=A0A445D3C5_ARAHY|nr:hypothetical protein Ahy_A05g023445 [Arachis hypogaea]